MRDRNDREADDGDESRRRPAEMLQFADFVADFVAHVQAAKKAGKTAAPAVAEWKTPAKYTGYAAPNAQRATAYAQIIFDETK